MKSQSKEYYEEWWNPLTNRYEGVPVKKEQAPKRGPGDHVTESNDDMQVYGY